MRPRSGSFYIPCTASVGLSLPQKSALSSSIASMGPSNPDTSADAEPALTTLPPPRRRRHIRSVSNDADDESPQGFKEPPPHFVFPLPPVEPVQPPRRFEWSPRTPSPLRKLVPQLLLKPKPRCPSTLFAYRALADFESFFAPRRAPSPPSRKRSRPTLLKFVLRAAFLAGPKAEMARRYGGLRIAWCVDEDIKRALRAGPGGGSFIDWSLPEAEAEADWTLSSFGDVEVEEDEVLEEMEDPFKRLSRSMEEQEPQEPQEEEHGNSSGSDGAEEVSMFDSESDEEWEEVVDNF